MGLFISSIGALLQTTLIYSHQKGLKQKHCTNYQEYKNPPSAGQLLDLDKQLIVDKKSGFYFPVMDSTINFMDFSSDMYSSNGNAMDLVPGGYSEYNNQSNTNNIPQVCLYA